MTNEESLAEFRLTALLTAKEWFGPKNIIAHDMETE
jgi:hypothetical protein